MNQRIYDLYNANSFVDTPMLRVEYPQILEAYFAEKKIIPDTNEVYFEFVQSTSIKTAIYVIIETTNFKGKKIRLSIKEDGEDHYVGVDKGVKILVDGKQVDYIEATVGEWDAGGEVSNKELFGNWAIFELELVSRRKGSVQWGTNVQVNTEIKSKRLSLIADAHVLNADFDDEAILYYGKKNSKNNHLNRW